MNNTQMKKIFLEAFDDYDDFWDGEEDKYSLIGQDGNAFSLMGYTARCMRECGLKNEIDQMRKEAMSGDYNHLIVVCDDYVQKCNRIARNEISEGLITDYEYEDMSDGIDYNYSLGKIGDKEYNEEQREITKMLIESSNRITWSDLTSSEQYAFELARQAIENGVDPEQAIRRACEDVSYGNIQPEYENEDFYGDEPDMNRVLQFFYSNYMKISDMN